MIRVFGSIVVDAPPDVVFQVISDISQRPEYSPHTEKVELVEREGDKLVAEVVVRLAGRVFTQRLQVTQRPLVGESFEQITGPLRAMRGRTTLTPVPGGTWLEQVYELEVDPRGLWSNLAGIVLQPAMRRETEGLLLAYKYAAERRWLTGHRPVSVPPLARRRV